MVKNNKLVNKKQITQTNQKKTQNNNGITKKLKNENPIQTGKSTQAKEILIKTQVNKSKEEIKQKQLPQKSGNKKPLKNISPKKEQKQKQFSQKNGNKNKNIPNKIEKPSESDDDDEMESDDDKKCDNNEVEMDGSEEENEGSSNVEEHDSDEDDEDMDSENGNEKDGDSDNDEGEDKPEKIMFSKKEHKGKKSVKPAKNNDNAGIVVPRTNDDHTISKRPPQKKYAEAMVSGLPVETTIPEIYKLFETCGRIVKISISNIIGFESGFKPETNLCTIITFDNLDTVNKAIECSGTEFKGRKFFVRLMLSKDEYRSSFQSNRFKPNVSIFIKNLKPGTNEVDVREFFSTCGKVTDVRLLDCQAYVRFATTDAVPKALLLNNQKLLDSNVCVLRYRLPPHLVTKPSRKAPPHFAKSSFYENNLMKKIEDNIMRKLNNKTE